MADYLCRDCLVMFRIPDMCRPTESEQYCIPCKSPVADRMDQARVRVDNLERMGLDPDQIAEDLRQWHLRDERYQPRWPPGYDPRWSR